jgi:hypothetical protein
MTTTSNPEGNVTDLEEVPRGAASTPTPTAIPSPEEVRAATGAAISALAVILRESWRLEDDASGDRLREATATVKRGIDTLHAAATEGAKAKEELARIDAARREAGQ